MKFKAKPAVVSAFCFDGTFTGPGGCQAADEFVKEHDIEDCEVTSQGTKEPLALDVTTGWGIHTLEAGDYLYVREGELHAESAHYFTKTHEVCDE